MGEENESEYKEYKNCKFCVTIYWFVLTDGLYQVFRYVEKYKFIRSRNEYSIAVCFWWCKWSDHSSLYNFFIYLFSIITNGLAIFKDSRKITVISGITALVYSGIIFFGILAVKSKLASSASDPFSRAIGSAVASMINVDIGVGIALLAALLLFGSLMVKEKTDKEDIND